jgi:hypothetical protein
MAVGATKAVVFLRKPIRVADAEYSVIYCEPIKDTASPLSGLSAELIFINLGSTSSNLGICTSIENIANIIYEAEDGALALVLADLTGLQGYLDLT